MVERVRVTIDGRVQGVGFRYATYRHATALGLTGWVRNLHDGRVQAEFEGPHEALDRMLDWCRKGPSFAYVTRVDEDWTSAAEAVHASFRIAD